MISIFVCFYLRIETIVSPFFGDKYLIAMFFYVETIINKVITIFKKSI